MTINDIKTTTAVPAKNRNSWVWTNVWRSQIFVSVGVCTTVTSPKSCGCWEFSKIRKKAMFYHTEKLVEALHLTAVRNFTMLPSYTRVRSVTPRSWFLTSSISTIVLTVLQFRKHGWRTVMIMRLLTVPTLTRDSWFGVIYSSLIKPSSVNDTIVWKIKVYTSQA